MEHLQNHNILASEQYSFREEMLIPSATYDFIEDILGSLDHSIKVMGIIAELMKTFAPVEQKILLEKLRHYRIRGISHDLCQIASKESFKKYIITSMKVKNVLTLEI